MSIQEFNGYSIIRDIAGGGMAHLFVVRNANGERVVVRSMKPEYACDRKARKNFMVSAKILADLEHPNIVRLIDHGHHGRVPFMILEYIEGRNLRELILHRAPLLTDNTFVLIRQMALALYHVHRAGYLHLDFKPENILVQDDTHITLIDFDLVMKRKSKPIRIRDLPGTPAYVAPEVLNDHLVEERADIYSFGVTCYEMLCYHKPHEAHTLDEARAAQVDPSIPPTPLSQHNPQVPPRLEAIILKCLAKLPDDRYPSLSLVIKDLESIL